MKKFFAGVVIGALSVASIPAALGLSEKLFSDVVKGSWYESAVYNLQELKIIQGYDDNSFQPEAPVSRAEMAVLLDRFKTYADQAYVASPTAPTNESEESESPPAEQPAIEPSKDWVIHDSKNLPSLDGIQYPANFYWREVYKDGAMLFIQSASEIMLLPGESTCGYDQCNEVEGGLIVAIRAYSEKPPLDQENLESTAFAGVQKVKELSAIEPMREKINLHSAYYFLGENRSYRIEVYEHNFNGDEQKVVEGILSRLPNDTQ